jgi:hypothetical protein
MSYTLAPLLTSTEAAKFLNLGNSRTLDAWRLRRQGPPYILVGRLARYRPADLAAWLESRTVAHPAVGAP